MAANDTRNVDFIICFFCCFWRLWRFWVILAGHFARLFYESETEDGDVAWWPRLFAAIVGRCWNCRGSLVELRLSACRAQVRGMLDRKGAFLQGEVLPLLLTQLLATRWHAIQERIWCIWIPFDRVKWYNVNSRGLIVKIWGQNKVKKALYPSKLFMIEPYLWRFHKGIQVVLKVPIDGRCVFRRWTRILMHLAKWDFACARPSF